MLKYDPNEISDEEFIKQGGYLEYHLKIGGYDKEAQKWEVTNVIKIANGNAYIYDFRINKFVVNNYFLVAKFDPVCDYDQATKEEFEQAFAELLEKQRKYRAAQAKNSEV